MKNEFLITVISLLCLEATFAQPISHEISALGNKMEHWKACSAFRIMKHRITDPFSDQNRLNPFELTQLEEHASGDEHQIRQLSSLLLVYHHLSSGLEMSALPDPLKNNLITALRNDHINPRNKVYLPTNAWYARAILLNNAYGKPLNELLYQELTGNDSQSARMASEILVKWHDKSKISDERLNHYLISMLRPELSSTYFFRTWGELHVLGRDNLQQIVSQSREWSEFQCAILQLLCSKHDIDWSPSMKIVAQWAALSSDKKNSHLHKNRIRQAAIYLHPNVTAASDQSGFPARTQQLFSKEGTMATAENPEKYKWICSWHPCLPQRP